MENSRWETCMQGISLRKQEICPLSQCTPAGGILLFIASPSCVIFRSWTIWFKPLISAIDKKNVKLRKLCINYLKDLLLSFKLSLFSGFGSSYYSVYTDINCAEILFFSWRLKWKYLSLIIIAPRYFTLMILVGNFILFYFLFIF